LDLLLFQLPYFTKTADDLTSDLDLWLSVLNNGRALNVRALPGKLRVAEIDEAREAWAMLTQDRMPREICEACERARRDAEDWKSALHDFCQREHPRRLPASVSGYVAKMGLPPISLKHSPASGEDQRLRSASCPRGRFSSRTRRQASRMPVPLSPLKDSTASGEDACPAFPAQGLDGKCRGCLSRFPVLSRHDEVF